MKVGRVRDQRHVDDLLETVVEALRDDDATAPEAAPRLRTFVQHAVRVTDLVAELVVGEVDRFLFRVQT